VQMVAELMTDRLVRMAPLPPAAPPPPAVPPAPPSLPEPPAPPPAPPRRPPVAPFDIAEYVLVGGAIEADDGAHDGRPAAEDRCAAAAIVDVGDGVGV
jgi:hypothetical protein